MKKLLGLLVFLASPVLAQWVPLSDAWTRLDGGIPVPSGYLTIKDETTAQTQRSILTFLGTGVTCVDSGANFATECTITAGSGYSTVMEEGGALTARGTLNFIGTNFTCADNAPSTRTDCTLGNVYATVDDEGTPLTQRPIIDFAGSGVACVDSGGVKTLCTITAGGTTPTGTGFTHITGGVQDAASKVVDVSSADITGTLAAARFLALTGDVTNTVGTVATTIANNVVSNAKLAQGAAYTVKGNATSATANETDMSLSTAGRLLSLPSLASATTFDVFDELNKGYVNNSTAYGGSNLMGNAVVSGTGTSVFPSNGINANSHTWIDANHPGVPECGGGTATADHCWLLQGVGSGSSSGQFIWTAGLAVEILFHGDTISDGTDTYTTFLGSTSTAVTTSIGVTNSVYASYTHSANSGSYVMNTCKASTCTTGNTATAYPGNAWQHVLIYVDAAGTGLHFSFGCTTPENPTACADATGSPIATTNLPTVAQHLAFGIVKTAGTNPRSIALDYVHIYMIPGTNLAR